MGKNPGETHHTRDKTRKNNYICIYIKEAIHKQNSSPGENFRFKVSVVNSVNNVTHRFRK